MRRIAAFLAFVLTIASAGSIFACEYNVNLFNHRLNGDTLRLYLDVTSIRGIIGDWPEYSAKDFDTVQNPGDAAIVAVDTYEKLGNGLGTLMLLDRGKSMRGMQGATKKAAMRYIDSMEQNDEIAIFFFSESRSEQAFTGSRETLSSRVNDEMPDGRMRPMRGNSKALYKHMLEGVEYVAERASKELSFLLVLTDGRDDVGGITDQQVIQAARNKRVGIFAVGFYQMDKYGKDNLRELQVLENIAKETGGVFVRADANDDLTGLFLRARERARHFAVIDSKLCGITRDQAAAGRVSTYAVYKDCRSNEYTFRLPPLEADLGACPQCKADADCKENERCVPDKAICEAVACGACKTLADHQCTDKKCAADADCGSDCSCAQGICGSKPPCEEWQVFDEASRMCVGKACKEDTECPKGFECCSQRCAKQRPCAAWQTREAATCGCLQVACKHDGQCPNNTLCDGEFCIDGGPNPPAPPKCEEGRFSVRGECKQLECVKDEDCKLGNDSGSMVCGAKVGLTKSDSVNVCQKAMKGPCDPWQEKVGDMCRDVFCDKDSDCSEEGSCDTENGQCAEGKGVLGKNPLLLGGIVVFGLAALLFLGLALRKKKEPPAPLVSSTPSLPPTGAVSSDRVKKIPTDVDMEVAGEEPQDAAPRQAKETAREEGSPFELSVEFSGYSKRYPLRRGRTSIGREEGDLLITNDVVSSRHLLVDVQDRGIFIQDFGSTNGTFIESRRLAAGESVRVNLGQPIMIGTSVCLKVLAPSLQGEASQRRRHAPTQVG